ncbi:MAG: DEAD/DEAH box helicase [Myxococcota bacterium]|nr:DEAD/DEAH box helicase [Myxococcota bacterium]
MSSFDTLDLIEPLRRAVAAEGYDTPTPIQAKAIPPLLEGRDVLGCAQTGTGKTAAFLLPILQHLTHDPRPGKRLIRSLVLTPTRELAAQIGDSFEVYGRFLDLTHVVIFGGVNQRPQVSSLRRGVDVLVATPGRLLDLHGQGHIDFNHVQFFVLDEADRMLDMGFIRDIRKVLALLPDDKQNLLFSATMPDSIVRLASAFLDRPVRVEVDPQSTTVEQIVQQVMFVARPDKKRLLRHLLRGPEVESAIVFTRTKHGANRVVKELSKADIEAAAIHGNKSQSARQRALAGFKAGDIRILVATDIASRGIDVEGVSHVFNYDLPNISESYVHRIGRTGRAGREGIAIAFCDESETAYLRDIERLTGKPLEVIADHDWHFAEAMPSRSRNQRGGRRRQRTHHTGQGDSQERPDNRGPDGRRDSRRRPSRNWHRRRRD